MPPYVPTPRSSNIAGFSYDPDTRDLLVEFRTGHSGTYRGVSQYDADAFADAPSHGQFLHDFIKPNYPYSRRT